MIQKNPFLKYVMKDKKEDVFHSSAYAKAQNSSIGVASTESYQVRVNMNQNRTRVRGYDESEVMTGAKANGPRAKKYTPPERTGGISGGAVKDNIAVARNRAMSSIKIGAKK